jgi:hypothetical protein
MSFAHSLAVAALASLPLAAIGQQYQQHHHPANPVDASTNVPASSYESVFKNYKAAADEQESPDKTWRAANDEVAKLGGHAGHIKSDSGASSAPLPLQEKPADHSKHH